MLFDLCQWLHELPVSGMIRESLWLFPTLESVHLCSMILMIAVLGAFDLRLLGIALARQPVSQLAGRILRVAWFSFGVNAITGAGLFASKATDYYSNSPFLIKILLVFVGLAFHGAVFRRAARWDDAPATAMPLEAKLVGGFSLLLWIGVIAASRWIAFLMADLQS